MDGAKGEGAWVEVGPEKKRKVDNRRMKGCQQRGEESLEEKYF